MEKLYVVRLMDKEDGGHLLDEAFFGKAGDARKEFLRIKEQMFNGYHYDQPGEWSWHSDNHFTHYDDGYNEVSLRVMRFETRIITNDESPVTFPLPKLFSNISDDEDRYCWSIDELFESEVEEASKSRNFNEGFKHIYNAVDRIFGHAITKCTYTKEDKPWTPATMTYFINTSDHGEVVVDVQKNNPEGKYSYIIVK